MPAVYNQIGHNYNHSRKADPYLVSRMYDGLNRGSELTCLDIGCGTGNYTRELYLHGMEMIGVDPSILMLNKAKSKYPEMRWFEGCAESIPLKDDSVDTCLGSLTIHHWESINKGFIELKRVIKSGGKLLLFTSLPSQMESYWLCHYFPVMMKDSGLKMPTWKSINGAAEKSGWRLESSEKYNVQDSLEDLFLYAGKHNPSFYLDEEVRKGISSFSAVAMEAEIRMGLSQLAEDIESGRIEQIMNEYISDNGDYLFISFVQI